MSKQLEQCLGVIDSIADELSRTITGNFELTLQFHSDFESLQKLIMLINFLLDSVRRTIYELEQKSIEKEELIKKLRTDQLTGILNRSTFYYLANKELGSASRTKDLFSIGILDLDIFKAITECASQNETKVQLT